MADSGDITMTTAAWILDAALITLCAAALWLAWVIL